jgi:hypothetical protein
LGLFRDWQYSGATCPQNSPLAGGMQGTIKPAGTTFRSMSA